MSIIEQASSRPGSRFGKLSSNMFFIRNTAKPKRVRHIEGLNGALICNVNDDPSAVRAQHNASLNLNRNNLPAFEIPRRTEKLVPPMGFWNTHGVIHDTDRWKQELAALASASGLGIERDEHKHSHKSQTATADQNNASRSGAHYSTRTGRFNEGAGKSRGRTGSKHATPYSDMLLSVSENEREMWMLQVLCQLLGTSHLEDVQSWLVSATATEKEQARTMINAALRGLKESERTSDQNQQNVDFNSLSNFVDKQQNEEKHISQKFIQDTLNRSAPVLPSIDEEQQADASLNEGWNHGENNHDHIKSLSQNMTTYRRAYHNYNQRSYTSFEGASPKKINDSFTENDHDQQQDNSEEEIDTIQLNDDRRRPRSGLIAKAKVQTKKSQSLVERPPSSHKQKHRVESVEFTDHDNENQLNHKNENENEDEHHHHQQQQQQQQQQQDLVASSNKAKRSSSQDDQSKTRKIRELQNKLSRQEEEAKKKFNELQSKQSRLENAIKLLSKQTSSFKKRRQHKTDEVEDLDAPVVNVIIQSPRDTDRRDKSQETYSLGKQLELSSVAGNEKLKKNRNGNNNSKIGDYTIQDVKVQISLSRLDNHPNKVYSGVWKPDVSTLHRLQGN